LIILTECLFISSLLLTSQEILKTWTQHFCGVNASFLILLIFSPVSAKAQIKDSRKEII